MIKSKNTKGLKGSVDCIDSDELKTLKADKKALERQLAEATNKLTRIESVCDGYKAMQSEYETDTEIPYWDIMNIIKGTTTKNLDI